MLIGISGKIGSGKDTVGKIILNLIATTKGFKTSVFSEKEPIGVLTLKSGVEIKKFADTLKDYVCMAIGCTREQLEDREFKDKELGEEWTNYGYAKGFWYHSDNNPSHKMMDSVPCSKERYEEELRVNWQTAYKQVMTPRIMLQLMGTEAMRNRVHPNFWVNALMSGYKLLDYHNTATDDVTKQCYESNWVITDLRFPNELKAIEDRKGITIRVERDSNIKTWLDCSNCQGGGCTTCNGFGKIRNSESIQHESETALDNAKFKYTIDNNGTIEELVEKVKEILTLEKII